MTCNDCTHCKVCERKNWHAYTNHYMKDLKNVENMCLHFKTFDRDTFLPKFIHYARNKHYGDFKYWCISGKELEEFLNG